MLASKEIILSTKGLTKEFGFGGTRTLAVDHVDLELYKGEVVSIVGESGSGKTTLAKMLLGLMEPHSGFVRRGTRIEVAYFDQHRMQLDDNKSVKDNVADGSGYVTVNGKSRHVIGYLEDFLFPPERARSPVKVLSGGERNRALLKWFYKMGGDESYVIDEKGEKVYVPITEQRETDYVRPWSVPQSRQFSDKLKEITLAILDHNKEGLQVFRDLAEGKLISFDDVDEQGNRIPDPARQRPLKVNFYYMLGNHDWYYHLKGEAL